MAQNYQVVSGMLTGDRSSSAAIIAAVSGRTLSVKSVVFNCGASAQNITLEKADGTDLIGPYYLLASTSSPRMEFEPGAMKADAGAALHIIASGSGNMTAVVEAYVL